MEHGDKTGTTPALGRTGCNPTAVDAAAKAEMDVTAAWHILLEVCERHDLTGVRIRYALPGGESAMTCIDKNNDQLYIPLPVKRGE